MNDNITALTKGGGLLSADAGKKIAEFERKIKKLEALENELRAEIMLEMQQKGILKAVSEDVTITYIPEGDRESFDTRSFRKDHPDLFDDYVKITKVKASVRIKINGD